MKGKAVKANNSKNMIRRIINKMKEDIFLKG
jgi:hypothetical protein